MHVYEVKYRGKWRPFCNAKDASDARAMLMDIAPRMGMTQRTAKKAQIRRSR